MLEMHLCQGRGHSGSVINDQIDTGVAERTQVGRLPVVLKPRWGVGVEHGLKPRIRHHADRVCKWSAYFTEWPQDLLPFLDRSCITYMNSNRRLTANTFWQILSLLHCQK